MSFEIYRNNEACEIAGCTWRKSSKMSRKLELDKDPFRREHGQQYWVVKVQSAEPQKIINARHNEI